MQWWWWWWWCWWCGGGASRAAPQEAGARWMHHDVQRVAHLAATGICSDGVQTAEHKQQLLCAPACCGDCSLRSLQHLKMTGGRPPVVGAVDVLDLAVLASPVLPAAVLVAGAVLAAAAAVLGAVLLRVAAAAQQGT
jgi:hypothetical protein